MRLSNNFKLEEFERSNTAGQLGIDNTAPREAIDNLSRLCTLLLQPLRDYYKTKIFINSGYRLPGLERPDRWRPQLPTPARPSRGHPFHWHGHPTGRVKEIRGLV